MRITYLAAASRDGFIARSDGDVAWLDAMEIDPEQTGLEAFFRRIDGLVMGRGTYDFVFRHGAWPYEDKPAWVCTSRPLQRLEGANLIVTPCVDEVLRDAAARGVEHLWLVGGGRLASSFLRKGLITDISLSEMPVQLHNGIPLFSEHRLSDLPHTRRTVTQKQGFRQIDIELPPTIGHTPSDERDNT